MDYLRRKSAGRPDENHLPQTDLAFQPQSNKLHSHSNTVPSRTLSHTVTVTENHTGTGTEQTGSVKSIDGHTTPHQDESSQVADNLVENGHTRQGLQHNPDREESNVRVKQRYMRQLQDQNKENNPQGTKPAPRKRYFNETQDGAERIEFEDTDNYSQPTQSEGTQTEHLAKFTDEHATDIEEPEQAFQHDTRPIVNSRRFPSRSSPRVSVHLNDPHVEASQESNELSDHHKSDHLPPKKPDLPPTTMSESVSDRRQPDSHDQVLPNSHAETHPPSYSQVFKEAKRVAKARTQPKVQVRRAWEDRSVARLIALIEDDDYGIAWSKIAGSNDPLLEGRDQMAIRDKARNIKVDFLKYSPLENPGFDRDL